MGLIAENRGKCWQLAGLWGLYFSFGLGFSGIPPLLHSMQAALDLTPLQMGHILGSWQFAYIFCAIPAAIFMVRRGVVVALSVSAVLVLGSLVLRVFATDYLSMLLAVALLGIAGPVVSIGCPLLVGQMFDGRGFGFAMGAYATAPVLANMLAFSVTEPVLMPILQNDWRMVLALWASVGGLCVMFWRLVRPPFVMPAGDHAAGLWDGVSRLERSFMARICMVGILVFFVDHGFKSWLPEIVRNAGYSDVAVASLATSAIGMWLLALLIVPGFIRDGDSYRWALLAVCVVLFGGSVGLVGFDHGPGFVLACLALGFAIGPLMTLGLIPIVARPEMTGGAKIIVMAFFFTFAEIGGTLGPVFFGAAYQMRGEFDLAFWFFCGGAILIPLFLLYPASLYRGGQNKVDPDA